MRVIMLFFMRLLEVTFFVGLAGSAVVVINSFFEDFGELLQRDK
jgi:hypothetical protein